MKPKNADHWAKQNRHDGDRWRLFRAVSTFVDAERVFYPGSYVDIAPSFVFPSVTYLDMDKRTPGFFEDVDGVLGLIADHDGPAQPDISFIHGDFTEPLELPDEHFDLLISLYAGFIGEYCGRHLKIGGTLLVNPSHGDAAMAALDDRYQLAAVIVAAKGDYRVQATQLETYLIPKKQEAVSRESLHESNRGIAYTRSPFGYLFTRVS